jgi:hypothetical protein
VQQGISRFFVRSGDHEFERCFAQDGGSEHLVALTNPCLRQG